MDSEHYEFDDADGLVREIVGPWVRRKHALLRRYVEISGVGVRRNWLKRGTAGATYIDLYAGPARARIRNSAEQLDGSPLVAWKQSVVNDARFTSLLVADASEAIGEAASTRLQRAGAPAELSIGPAIQTVDRIVSRLNPFALHFAFLDPYSLGALPFEILRKLAGLERMDLLIHVSVQDLNRNLRRYVDAHDSALDQFAPGWRAHVGDTDRSDEYLRFRIWEHWRNLLKSLGMETAEAAELVTGELDQPLYWLAFVARHPRALEFWEKIRAIEPDPQSRLF